MNLNKASANKMSLIFTNTLRLDRLLEVIWLNRPILQIRKMKAIEG